MEEEEHLRTIENLLLSQQDKNQQVSGSTFFLCSVLTTRLKSFVNAQLVEGCIQCQDQAFLPYPKDEIKKLYVRKCYEDVFHLLIQHINLNERSFGISGTPGIGKSIFFVYILYRLMDNFGSKTLSLKVRRIVYHHVNEYTCFDLGKQTVVELNRLNAKVLVREKDTFYIVDGRTSPLSSSCIVLFISYPLSEYKRFVKQNMAREWFLPVWTLAELEACQLYCYPNLSIEILKERYRIYGGVARSEALADVDAVKGVCNIGILKNMLDTTHTLLHILVSNDGLYQFTHVDIASKHVGEQLWIRHSAQMITNLQQMFGSFPNEIARHLFEIYGHMVFSVGGRTLKCKCLESGAASEITLDALHGQRISYGKDTIPAAEELAGNYYEATDDDTFPAIDSLSLQGMFQFTIAVENPILGVQILKKLCEIYEEPKLYYVVPPHRFASFKKQSFKAKTGTGDVTEISNLKQYVLELPFYDHFSYN
ncbi:hypothetical protein O9G_004148 [Rozella allomycis CSF55]|uniref:Crinkler (CRN) family protein n=1 Tax=Rozella allomycis (strain CSF55) TaxID=988480 RepID=A0A075B008_ROZAC|nr:hypothetical protein O9G_004148 [Rozella allomycis CSF55]|eukprot:EPZ35863.1 hypothetical protein O9G_004148 [Rozella allomycis CSF55]